MASPKNYCKFSKEQDEILIDSVSRHPALYDASEKAYKDNVVRDNIWREIAAIINRSAQDCKTRWRTLRDLYNRKLKLTKNKPTGTAASSKGSTWEYLDHMSFLRKVPNEKSSFTNVSGIGSPVSNQPCENDQETVLEETVANETVADMDETGPVEDEEQYSNPKRSFEDSEIPKKGANKKKKTERVIEVIEKRGEERDKLFRELLSAPSVPESNPIMTFFQSMAQTVMTFPPNLAVKAKTKVCQIVTELEYRSISQYQESSHLYPQRTIVRGESHSSLDNNGTSLDNISSLVNSPQNTESVTYFKL